MFILIYWYENYSNINVTLLASLTQCTAVQLNYCKAETSCWNQPSRKCSRYLNKITEHSDINIRFPGSWATYLFSLHKDGCVVLQFRETLVLLDEVIARCSMELIPDYQPLPGTEFTYHIIGNLDLYFDGSNRPNDWMFFEHTTQAEDITFSVDPKNRLRNCEKQPSYWCRDSHYTYMLESANDTDISFFITARSKSPTHRRTFSVSVVMRPVTTSWADITVWKKTKEEDLSGLEMYLSEPLRFLSNNKSYAEKLGASMRYLILITLDRSGRSAVSDFPEIFNNTCHFYYKSSVKNKIRLRWKWEFPLSNLINGQLISLFGKASSVSIYLGEMDDDLATNISVVLTWIHDNYDEMSSGLNFERTGI